MLAALVTLLLLQSGVAINIEEECVSKQEYAQIRLPRINLSKYVNGTDSERQEIVRSFKQYIHEFGSVSLYNHQISTELLDEMRIAGFNFFKKSEDYKLKYVSNGHGTPGYDPFGTVTAAAAYEEHQYGADDCDYVQMFAFFNHIAGSKDYTEFLPQKNNAPLELYDLSRKYIPEIKRVMNELHHMASEALLGTNNTDFFDNIHKKTPHFQLRWLKYNTFNNSEQLNKENKFGLAAHKDYLGFTLFIPGDARGLQNKIGGIDGIWMDCETDGDLRNDIFVNVGELYEVWTNGYWKANWHRVILDTHPDRITLSFFTGPDQDLMVQPIDGCSVCTQNQQQYASRTAAQHAKSRFSKGDKNVNPNGLKFYSD